MNSANRNQRIKRLLFIFNSSSGEVAKANETSTGPLGVGRPRAVGCAGLTLTEDGGAAVVAPEGVGPPGQGPGAAPLVLPRARGVLLHPGQQEVLEVFNCGTERAGEA